MKVKEILDILTCNGTDYIRVYGELDESNWYEIGVERINQFVGYGEYDEYFIDHIKPAEKNTLEIFVTYTDERGE